MRASGSVGFAISDGSAEVLATCCMAGIVACNQVQTVAIVTFVVTLVKEQMGGPCTCARVHVVLLLEMQSLGCDEMRIIHSVQIRQYKCTSTGAYIWNRRTSAKGLRLGVSAEYKTLLMESSVRVTQVFQRSKSCPCALRAAKGGDACNSVGKGRLRNN